MSVFGETAETPRRNRGSVRVSAGTLTLVVVGAILGAIATFLIGMEVGRRQGIEQATAAAAPRSIDAAVVLGPELDREPTVDPAAPVPEPVAAVTVAVEDVVPDPPAPTAEAPAAAAVVAAAPVAPAAPAARPPRVGPPQASDLEKPEGRPPGWEQLSGERPAPAGAGGAWFVQVLATPDEIDARLLAQKLEAAGYPVFLTPTRKDGMTWHRVRVGTYGARSDAVRVSRELKRRFEIVAWVSE